MRAQITDLTDELATIHSDCPRAIRNHAIEALRSAVPADLGAFVKCSNVDDQYCFTAMEIRGDQELTDVFRQLEDKPALETPWMPSNIDPEIANTFVRVHEFYGEQRLRSFAIQRELMIPLEVGDQVRAVFFDGVEMLGWIGLLRRGATARFRESEEQMLSHAAAAIKSTLSAAEALEATALEGGLFAAFGPCGALEHASKDFDRWASADRRSALRGWIRQHDTGNACSNIKLIGGAEVRLVRMDGPAGVRYLATVDRATLLELRPELWLTKRQREIAQFAACGASSPEIAAHFDLSVWTVKTHMKNIYERLGVGSRLELSQVLCSS
jgi:DNA-binding CsgD family transcriptional regulator